MCPPMILSRATRPTPLSICRQSVAQHYFRGYLKETVQAARGAGGSAWCAGRCCGRALREREGGQGGGRRERGRGVPELESGARLEHGPLLDLFPDWFVERYTK